jgi:mannose-1-phosphate guanylyltransferase
LLVQRGLPFYAIQHPFNWIDIGVVADYWLVMQQMMQGFFPSMPIPGKQIKPGVWVGLNVHIDWEHTHIEGPVYIGSGSRVDKNARIIGPTWISNGCHIQRDSTVIRSILFDYTRIAQDYKVEERIVCGEYCVDRNGRMVHFDDENCDIIWTDAREKVVYPQNYAYARL